MATGVAHFSFSSQKGPPQNDIKKGTVSFHYFSSNATFFLTAKTLLPKCSYVSFFSGFIADQRRYQEIMRNSTQDISAVGPGMAEPVDRFRLNNLSFAGPVVMGVGGKKKKKSIHYHPSLGAVISVNREESYLLMLYCKCKLLFLWKKVFRSVKETWAILFSTTNPGKY